MSMKSLFVLAALMLAGCATQPSDLSNQTSAHADDDDAQTGTMIKHHSTGAVSVAPDSISVTPLPPKASSN